MEYSLGKRLLYIDHLHLSLGGVPILRDVVAEIRDVFQPGMVRGQIVGFLGPSGMGKTQLFRCMAGLQETTSGAVFANDDQEPVRAGQVGVVAQDYPLLETRTVLDNLVRAATLAGFSRKMAT